MIKHFVFRSLRRAFSWRTTYTSRYAPVDRVAVYRRHCVCVTKTVSVKVDPRRAHLDGKSAPPLQPFVRKPNSMRLPFSVEQTERFTRNIWYTMENVFGAIKR